MFPAQVLNGRIYTDGSSVKLPTGDLMHGIGVFSKSLNIAYAANVTTAESYDHPTINGCELLAIKKALLFLEKAQPGRYEIVSDSKFALQAIQSGKSTFPKLQFIITEIK